MAKRLHLKCEVVLMWQFNAPRILHKNQLKNTIFSTIIDYSIQLVKTGRTGCEEIMLNTVERLLLEFQVP